MKIENTSLLSLMKDSFEKKLIESVRLFDSTPLGEACRYSLLTGGKRIRPIILYIMKEALNAKEDVSDAAIALEYFHTASLIADDLPCMDNDDFRRDHLTNHKKFGEATALLASYGLIIAAFEKIHQATEKSNLQDKETRGILALKEVSWAAGTKGATQGQFLDLFSKKGGLNDFFLIIEKKTVHLFEVAFLLGWLFSGGEIALAESVKRIGYHFGFAFQLADDLLDLDQDIYKEKHANFALYLGKDKALELFYDHLNRYERAIQELGLNHAPFLELEKRLRSKVEQSRKG